MSIALRPICPNNDAQPDRDDICRPFDGFLAVPMIAKHICRFSAIGSYVLGVIAGLLIVGMVVATLYEVISRTIFDQPTFWSVEITSYFVLYSVFLGSPNATLRGTHVALVLIPLPRFLRVVGQILSGVFLAIFAYAAWITTHDEYSIGSVTPTTLAVPVFLLDGVVLVGLVLMLMVLVIRNVFGDPDGLGDPNGKPL